MAKYEVVISGMSGTLPGCYLSELEEKYFFSNESMIKKKDSLYWNKVPVDMPKYVGDLPTDVHADGLFFGITPKLLEAMSHNTIMCLEKSFEALCDAGINPNEIHGSKTGVAVANTKEKSMFVLKNQSTRYAMLGEADCMASNRVSYFLDLSGPSFTMEGNWTSSLQVLQIAASWIARGEMKYAIVGTVTTVSQSILNVHYDNLKCLNMDGKTKSFSADADGFCRSATNIFFVLQRAEEAYKSYGTVVHVDTSMELNNKSHIFDSYNFSSFMTDFYSNANVNKEDIAYIEGDGSASLKLDAMELNCYADLLTPEREKPLPVGSCKSKFGHTFASSGMLSIVNALIAFKTGYIPPTLYFSSPNPMVPALIDGRMKVVTEKTPLEGDLIGITSIGKGSAYGHVLLKRNPKSRHQKQITSTAEDLPRIFLITGRNESKMKERLDYVVNKPVDENFYAINYNFFKNNIPKHIYRGFSIVDNEYKKVHINLLPDANKPVWYIFSGMGSQWTEMGKYLLNVPMIRKTIQKCHDILLPLGVDLISIITSSDKNVFDNILNAFVGITSIQIALIDLLEEIGVKPDGLLGHSVGELGCSYADKCLTFEQTLLSAYYRGKASNEAVLIKGMMAAVGKGYSQIKDDLPKEIEVACHNSNSSCTLSGPKDIMEKYVGELKSKGVFAKLVNVADIAYHSQYIKPAAPFLLNYLQKLIPEPKLRSSKWISSSVPEQKWDQDEAKYCSAEYLTNNLLNHVLFEEATTHIPKDAICIEIAPHGLLQAIVKKSLSSCTHIPLTNRSATGNSFLFEAIAQLFANGVEIDLSKLYPPVEFPVARETDIMDVITWDHDSEPMWYTPMYTPHHFHHGKDVMFERKKLSDKMFLKSKIMGHFINMVKAVSAGESPKCFLFNNIKLNEDPYFNKSLRVETMYQRGAGTFEALYKKKPIISGNVIELLTMPAPFLSSKFVEEQPTLLTLSGNQITEFSGSHDINSDYQFEDITSISVLKEGFTGKIQWRGDFGLYLKALFEMISLYSTLIANRSMELKKIRELLYDPIELPEENGDVEVYYSEHANYLCTKGIRVIGLKTYPASSNTKKEVDIRSFEFTPYSKLDSKINFANMCLQLIQENGSSEEVFLDVIVDKTSKLSKHLVDIMMNNQMSNKYKVHLRPKEIVSTVSKEMGYKTFFLVVAENSCQDHVNELLIHNLPFYLIHIGSSIEPHKLLPMKQLTPIIEQDVKGCTLTLLKQKKFAIENSVFVQMAKDDLTKEVEVNVDNGLNKTYFLIYKYRHISDIINVLQSSISSGKVNRRFVFIDESSPPFDVNNEFYKQQLLKDLMVNVSFKKTWGSIRDVNDESVTVAELERIVNDIRCNAVDLNVLGLNVQSIMFPNKYKKLNIIEYSGTKEGKEVLGIGKITEGNYLLADPILCWEKPDNWSSEEAATVPYYYCVAYDLYKKVVDSLRPFKSVLIHGGFTPFGQTLITVAIEKGLQIFTTCNFQEQKTFLKKKFPQINENYICLYGPDNRSLFQHVVMEATNGVGASMIFDAFEDDRCRTETLFSVCQKGSYYIMINKDIDDDAMLGLSLIMTECKLQGYNPEMLLERSEEEKQALFSLVENGIKRNVVKPLDKHCISTQTIISEAENIILSESQKMFPRKTLLSMKKPLQMTKEAKNNSNMMQEKYFMIIGSYNGLWYDILKWSCSNGATTIHLVMDFDEINLYLKERLMKFIEDHKSVSILISGIQNISSDQYCKNFIKGINLSNTIDMIFYVKPGFEKELRNVDHALRLHSKDSCLLAIGLQACRVTETRRLDGFKGVSFLLKKGNFANKMFIDSLNVWSKKLADSGSHVLVKPLSQSGFDVSPADILPSDISELLDLEENVVKTPSFIEMNTKCLKDKFAKELNPVILFPGLKLKKLRKMASELLYPTYMAQYPCDINSLDNLGCSFAKLLMKMFDNTMYTLVAEGWSGPLVLTVTRLLEEQGKQCEVILLDAAPETIKHWNKVSNSILHQYILFNKKISVNELHNWSSKICNEIAKAEDYNYSESKINSCFKILINRLNVIENYTLKNKKFDASVFLFTPYRSDENQHYFEELCDSFQAYCVSKPSNSFLENPELIEKINDLPIVEFKTSAKQQTLKDLAVFSDAKKDWILY